MAKQVRHGESEARFVLGKRFCDDQNHWFLGCGNMGGAIARAVCKAADPQNVYLANRTASKAEKLAGELGCKVPPPTRRWRPGAT